MKVFISQPMNGIEEKDILDLRAKLFNIFVAWQRSQGYIEDIEMINTYDKLIPTNCGNERIWCLGDSISLMAQADVVIFAPGWQSAKGCKVEHMIAREYGLKMYDYSEPFGHSYVAYWKEGSDNVKSDVPSGRHYCSYNRQYPNTEGDEV